MTLTEVNRLNKAVKNIKDEYYVLMSNRWGPRWLSGWRVNMVSGNQAARLNENIRKVRNRWEKAEKNLNDALNRNTESLQAQQREIRRTIKRMYEESNAARKALVNLNSKEYRTKNANEKAKIKKEKIPYKVILKRFQEQKAEINAERNRLMKNQLRLSNAIRMRKRILNRKPSEEQARRTIGRALSRSIVPRTLYGPYGTRTLSAMRQFPGYKEPTLEEYAAARRQINRLRKNPRV